MLAHVFENVAHVSDRHCRATEPPSSGSFPQDQVDGLNSVGSFVDGSGPCIPSDTERPRSLLRTPYLRDTWIPMDAISTPMSVHHALTMGVKSESLFPAKALLVRILTVDRYVRCFRCHIQKGPHRLGVCLHREKHAAHVKVFDDGYIVF